MEAIIEVVDGVIQRSCTCCGQPAVKVVRVGSQDKIGGSCIAFGVCYVHLAELGRVVNGAV